MSIEGGGNGEEKSRKVIPFEEVLKRGAEKRAKQAQEQGEKAVEEMVDRLREVSNDFGAARGVIEVRGREIVTLLTEIFKQKASNFTPEQVTTLTAALDDVSESYEELTLKKMVGFDLAAGRTAELLGLGEKDE